MKHHYTRPEAYEVLRPGSNGKPTARWKKIKIKVNQSPPSGEDLEGEPELAPKF